MVKKACGTLQEPTAEQGSQYEAIMLTLANRRATLLFARYFTVSFRSRVPIMYAKNTLVTAARTQVLSVEMARLMVGGDVPMSQIYIDGCVQNSAYVEFWDR
jgi:hypothetical protein